jgi:hypothetical protein
MKFNSRQNGPYAQNTSARAPGSNGPASLPSGGSGPQAGVTEVVANPGDPEFSAQQNLTGQHPKSRQVPTHSAHANNTDPYRGTIADGQDVLDAGEAAATRNDWAGG